MVLFWAVKCWSLFSWQRSLYTILLGNSKAEDENFANQIFYSGLVVSADKNQAIGYVKW